MIDSEDETIWGKRIFFCFEKIGDDINVSGTSARSGMLILLSDFPDNHSTSKFGILGVVISK